MPRARRCSIRGCARQGLGDPPFCQEHVRLLYHDQPPVMDDPIAAVVDALLNHPKSQGVLDNVSSKVDWFAQFLDQATKRVFNGEGMPRSHAREQYVPPRDHRQQTPPPREPRRPEFNARKIMGFAPTEVLTLDTIRKRYRELAKKHHPDKGGSAKNMALINNARDALLKELEGR